MTTKRINYIGVDLSNDSIIITNGNPYMEGLLDIHKCVYLPSGHNNVDIYSESVSIGRVIKYNLFPNIPSRNLLIILPSPCQIHATYCLNFQNALYMELPDTELHTAGIASGLFFYTPKVCK